MKQKRGIWNRFGLPKAVFYSEIINPLKEQNIDLQTIDLNACDEQNDIDGIKQYIEQEYGIILHKALTKADIESQEQYKNQQFEQIRQHISEQQRTIQDLFATTTRRIGDKDVILKEIINYAPFSEPFTISTLLAIKSQKNILNVSKAGMGKSRCVLDLLKLLELPFNEIRGHITPKRFYQKLRELNGSLIIIDESANIFSNPLMTNLLLSALQNHEIYWETSTGESDEPVKFTGTIIFNTNMIPNNAIIDAVSDRCIYNNIQFKPQHILEKIKSSFTYKPAMPIWGIIKNNLFLKSDLTSEEKDILTTVILRSNPKSVRDKDKLFLIGELSVSLLGSLDLLRFFVKIDNIDQILYDPDLKRSEKVKLIAQEKGVSERQARNIIKETE